MALAFDSWQCSPSCLREIDTEERVIVSRTDDATDDSIDRLDRFLWRDKTWLARTIGSRKPIVAVSVHGGGAPGDLRKGSRLVPARASGIRETDPPAHGNGGTARCHLGIAPEGPSLSISIEKYVRDANNYCHQAKKQEQGTAEPCRCEPLRRYCPLKLFAK
jgi:hypothetical protein